MKIKQNNEKVTSWVSISYIPHLNEELKKTFIKHNISFHSSSGPKLGNILFSFNKSKHKKIDQKGVYKLTCSCDMNKAYIGQTRVSIKTRMKQHRSEVESKKADSEISGISKHACYRTHGKINWETLELLEIEKKKQVFTTKKSLGEGEP